MHNGLSQVYCIKPEGRMHWYTKGTGYLYNEINTYFEIMIGEENQTIYIKYFFLLKEDKNELQYESLRMKFSFWNMEKRFYLHIKLLHM